MDGRKLDLLGGLILAFWSTGGVLADPAGGAGDEAPACSATADSLYKACLFDVGDTLFTAIANCRNRGTEPARERCLDAARAARESDAAECRDVRGARRDTCELVGENRYAPDPLKAHAGAMVDPSSIPAVHAPNPYVSLAAGRTFVFRAGENGEETGVVHVTNAVREIRGAPCRVVADVAVERATDGGVARYMPLEVTDDWLAQDGDGNVYYCGELSQSYEDGVLRDLDGSFEAGRDSAKAGYLIKAAPAVGSAHRQEFALGEAEDVAQYLDLHASPNGAEGGENAAFPCNGACLKTLELTALEPGQAEHKYYRPGIGLVLTVGLEDGAPSGDRETLVCEGDSLAVLRSSKCGIDDADALLEALCRLAPDVFCPR